MGIKDIRRVIVGIKTEEVEWLVHQTLVNAKGIETSTFIGELRGSNEGLEIKIEAKVWIDAGEISILT